MCLTEIRQEVLCYRDTLLVTGHCFPVRRSCWMSCLSSLEAGATLSLTDAKLTWRVPLPSSPDPYSTRSLSLDIFLHPNCFSFLPVIPWSRHFCISVLWLLKQLYQDIYSLKTIYAYFPVVLRLVPLGKAEVRAGLMSLGMQGRVWSFFLPVPGGVLLFSLCPSHPMCLSLHCLYLQLLLSVFMKILRAHPDAPRPSISISQI